MLLFLSLLSGLLCLEIISTWGSSFCEGGGGVLPQISSLSFSELCMRVMILVVLLSFLGCVHVEPTEQQVAIWTYFLRQCQNEGINDLETMKGCIALKARQTDNEPRFGDVLQGMGAALQSPTQPQSVDCHTTTLIGGYRTVCQ